jgi:rhodanese-related sulfurtransferase
MEHFVVFITNHWVLSALWGGCLVLFLANEFWQRRVNAKSVTPEQAVQLINHCNAVILDLRSDSAFAEGHILGAEHVLKDHWERKIKNYQKQTEKTFIVVCSAGHDSLKRANELQQTGFTRVVILKGGIDAWKMSGLPLVKS